MGRPGAGGGSRRLPQPDYDAIIVRGDVDKLVAAAEEIGEVLVAGRLKNSQIRGIFASVRQIQLNWSTNEQKAYRDAILLKPRIAYTAARNDLVGLDSVLIEALNRVKGAEAERRERFMRFVDFFEAIVAYHKQKGGAN